MRKYLTTAAVAAAFMSFAATSPAAAQEPGGLPGAMPAPAAAYGSLVTAMTHAHLQLQAVSETELETAQIALIDIADVVPEAQDQAYTDLLTQHNDHIVALRTGLKENEAFALRLTPFLTAAEIEEEPAVFMKRVIAIDVDRDGNAIAIYYDGRR
jgi:hypothetical protein